MYMYERGWESADHLRLARIDYINYQDHVHPCMEFDFCVSGRMTAYVEGRPYEMEENDGLFVPPHIIHNRKLEEGTKILVLHFGRNWTADFANQFSKHTLERFTFHMDQTLRDMLEEYEAGYRSSYAAKAMLYHACDLVMRGNSLKLREKGRDDVTVRMLEYIQNNFREELTLQEFAAKNNFSYHYVSKLVKKNFGISFTDLLAQYRVDYACTLLNSREYGITQIASMSGFGSIRNFNRVFLRQMGVTPTEYQASN